MAQGKYSRVDGRKSSSYWSTVSIAVFVVFCLVGIWTFMSSMVPVQNSDLTSEEAVPVSQVKQMVTENDSRQFKDISGDLLEDSTNGDGNTRNDQNIVEKESGNTVNENQEEVVIKESSDSEQTESEERLDENKSESVEGEKKSEKMESQEGTKQEDKVHSQTAEEANEQNQDKHSKNNAAENNMEIQENDRGSDEVFPTGAQSEILNETTTQDGAWSTQAKESQNEKESQQSSITKNQSGYSWKVCKVTAGPDYIPCLDNWQAIKKLPGMGHYEHRERHCPEEAPTCLVPLPEGYRFPVKWPTSREKVYHMSCINEKLLVVYLILKIVLLVPDADMVLQCSPHQACRG